MKYLILCLLFTFGCNSDTDGVPASVKLSIQAQALADLPLDERRRKKQYQSEIKSYNFMQEATNEGAIKEALRMYPNNYSGQYDAYKTWVRAEPYLPLRKKRGE